MSITPSFEPFRAKTVEPIRLTTPLQRRQALIDAGFDLFRIYSNMVLIDLLTDSGTGAMSASQWAAMMQADESYAGSASYRRLADAVEAVTGMANVLPTAQGRVSERLLAQTLLGGQKSEVRSQKSEVRSQKAEGRDSSLTSDLCPRTSGRIVPNNAHFDTTRAMIEGAGAEAINLLSPGADDPHLRHPFKGNIDLTGLESLLTERGDDVPFVMLTVTCNSIGGQPVSLENLRAVRALCDRFGKLLMLDACRFAENAWFIKAREMGQNQRSIRSIVREMFDLCDGAALSARKDGLCNTGGLLLLRDAALFRKACDLSVLTQGFGVSYGGLAARDMEAIAVGLHEAIDESFLAHRARMIELTAQRLIDAGVPIVQPVGGHAIYLDAELFCPHIGLAHDPGHALACALFERAGIRSCRMGMALRRNGRPMSVVRLAVPRRTYADSHLAYVAEAVIDLKAHATGIMPAKSPAPVKGAAQWLEPEYQVA